MKHWLSTPRRAGLALCLAAALLALEAQAARHALVVGNDNYQNPPATKLRNARNDATAIARELEAAGFQVTRVFDATRAMFNEQLEGFLRRVNKGDEVVFYFSGHGSQPPLRGPYLLPVDIKVTERSIIADGQSLELLVAELNAKAKFAMVIIDACRNDPFRETSAGRSMTPGSSLANIAAPSGSVILMAASKGQEALDRVGNNDTVPNGLFTRELIKWMRKPGVPVREVLHQVKFSVERTAKSVNHEQRPSIIDESSDDFFFYPGGARAPAVAAAPAPVFTPPPAAAPAPAPAAPAPAVVAPPPAAAPVSRPAPAPAAAPAPTDAQREFDAWEAAQRAGTRPALEGFIARYPQGRYSGFARAKLAELPAPAAAPAPAPAARPAAANPQAEFELWDKAFSSKRRADYEAYLAAYPDGRYATLAREGLKSAR